MRRDIANLWTIDELGSQVALALSVGYEGQANGRIRDVPDRRTIRYYTTLGLIDRPARMWGRTALYGRRHLLQLVAIKRLQARGLSLAELQQRLLGLPDAALEEIARLPADMATPTGQPRPAEPEAPPRDADFWKAAPAPLPPAGAAGEGPAQDDHASLLPLQGVPLGDEVTLLLSPSRPLEADDIEAIRTVAAPLLKLLGKRRLLRPPQERRDA